MESKQGQTWAAVSAQLAERRLPTPEIDRSDPDIDKFIRLSGDCLEKTKIYFKKPEAQLRKNICAMIDRAQQNRFPAEALGLKNIEARSCPALKESFLGGEASLNVIWIVMDQLSCDKNLSCVEEKGFRLSLRQSQLRWNCF